jgi:hypothetical protein
MLLIDWFLNNLLNAEGGISRRIEALRRCMQNALFGFPELHLLNLNEQLHTCLCLSTSEILTICPIEGITLILILLNE